MSPSVICFLSSFFSGIYLTLGAHGRLLLGQKEVTLALLRSN